MDALVTLLLLATPCLVVVLIDRLLPGRDQPMTVFLASSHIPWSRSGPEEDPPRWPLEVIDERVAVHRVGSLERSRTPVMDVTGPRDVAVRNARGPRSPVTADARHAGASRP
jgi:hypothetical protein